MNPLLLLIILVLVGLQAGLSRRWAFLPLLIAACHTPYTPFAGGLTAARVVILIGLIRAASSQSPKTRNYFGTLLMMFAGVALLSTLAHTWQPYNPLIVRLRLVLDVGGTYLYARAYLSEKNAFERLGIGLAVTLVPFALCMAIERQTGMNPYRLVGTQNIYSMVRDGQIRAQGPFGTPILAGTVGASSIPILIALWNSHRRIALLGLGASMVVIIATASSGPIATMLVGVAAIAIWRYRHHLKSIITATVLCLIVLQMVKNRPIWYLMAIMDFIGGSTGWHRAYLIDTSVKHLNEWWFLGTDFTRHWMPYGLAAVPEHCDLTNYYIQLGVTGGLPLMGMLLLIQRKAFRSISDKFRDIGNTDIPAAFQLWCLGSALFAHAITFLSISYFDQMSVFFWILIGGMAGFLTDSETGNAPITGETHRRQCLRLL